MKTDLDHLIAMSREVRMSDEQWEEQRRSFVYGNTHIENESITRDMVARACETVSAHG